MYEKAIQGVTCTVIAMKIMQEVKRLEAVVDDADAWATSPQAKIEQLAALLAPAKSVGDLPCSADDGQWPNRCDRVLSCPCPL